MWFLNQLLPSSSAYNVAARIDIAGVVKHEVLQRSLDAVVARHEVLRTTFHDVQGAPKAVLTPVGPFELPYDRMATESEVDAAAAHEAAAPFDIGTGPLLRARLYAVGEQQHTLVLTMHHIVTDGWSFRVLLRDLAIAYQALEHNEPVPLADLPIQYADFAHWQRNQLRGTRFDASLQFWKSDLAGAPPLELDTDRPRPKTPTFRGARMHFDLGRERTDALRTLCRGANVTISVPLLAALAVVLNRYSGQDDLVVGTLTANRARLETQDLIGLFVNTLPLRIKLDGDPDLAELLERVGKRMVDVLEHQDAPFDLIVNAVAPDRDANRHPLFGVQLVVQPAVGAAELSGLGLTIAEIDTQTAKRDLTVTFVDDEQLDGHVEYASDLFDEIRIERFVDHFRSVIDTMTAGLGQRLSSVPMLTESDWAHYRTNRVSRATAAATIPELFENTVDRAPGRVAVTADATSLTYAELDVASNRLARWLRGRGIETGTAVGLSVGRTASMTIGMLGILKAGGVYVPIDPSYPGDRVAGMLLDADVTLLLGDEDVESVEVLQQSDERLETVSAPDDLAYIMYTSGSTGRPKGVAVRHGSVTEYAETMSHELGVTADDVYLETASLSFSSSIRQLVVPFTVGAHVVIATADERRDPAQLLRRVTESAVTVADLVPTVVRGLLDSATRDDVGCVDLRLLLTASEPLRAGVVRTWRDRMGADATWINMYGQTETTGIVSLYRVGELSGSDQSIVPIGRPRPNVGMYVLDSLLRRLPPGVSGELFVTGAALARDYLGDPTLTAQKFVRAPWDPDERLYATGDVVRLGYDGVIEYRNRTDRQVKIRGLRVEPAEIDRVLLDHPGVRDAVTVAQHTDGGDEILVAYVAVGAAPVATAELRAHARLHLPEHMVPSAFLSLERLPLTLNGKLDVAALPAVAIERDRQVEYVAPREGTEESLAAIWRNALGVEQIGAGDNFFSLGGHSLLLAQMRSRIHQEFGVELSLDALFDDQTLADVARRIDQTSTDDVDVPLLRPATRTGALPVSYAQELMWQAECDEPGAAKHWIDVSVRITGPLNAQLVVCGVRDAVRRFDVLRTTFRSTGTAVSQVILDSYVPDIPILEAVHNGVAATEWRDLGDRPPFRAEVLRIAEDDHVLRLRVHRILADGHSMRLLLNEIAGYVADAMGLDGFSPLNQDVQYSDYAAWERSWLIGDALTRRVEHFRRQFDAHRLHGPLPTDHPRGDRRPAVGHQFPFEFPRDVASAARELAVREQASLYTVLLAAFASAVGRYADRQTVTIASPLTMRGDPATQLILGPFMNTAPLIIDLAAAPDLTALVLKTKTQVLGAMSNQHAPWQQVLAALAAAHGPAAQSIGDVGFLMDDPAPGELSAGGFTLTRLAPERIIPRRELTAALSTAGEGITGMVTYDAALFEPESIERIVADFVSVLTVSEADRAHEEKIR